MILYFQLPVFMLQLFVLTAHVEQDEIIFDESPSVMPHQLQALLHRRYRGDGPDADERDILVAFYLISNQQQLRHKDDQQDREIAVSAEEKIHNIQNPGKTARVNNPRAGCHPAPQLTRWRLYVT